MLISHVKIADQTAGFEVRLRDLVRSSFTRRPMDGIRSEQTRTRKIRILPIMIAIAPSTTKNLPQKTQLGRGN